MSEIISYVLLGMSGLLIFAGMTVSDEDEAKRTLFTLAIYAILLSIRLAL